MTNYLLGWWNRSPAEWTLMEGYAFAICAFVATLVITDLAWRAFRRALMSWRHRQMLRILHEVQEGGSDAYCDPGTVAVMASSEVVVSEGCDPRRADARGLSSASYSDTLSPPHPRDVARFDLAAYGDTTSLHATAAQPPINGKRVRR